MLHGKVFQVASKLKLAPHAAGHGFLLGERAHYVLRDEAVLGVLGLVDGKRRVEQIIADCGGVVPDSDALRIIESLRAAGAIEEPRGEDPGRVAFESMLFPNASADQLVEVVGAGRTATDPELQIMRHALGQVGLAVAPPDAMAQGACARVIVAADYLPSGALHSTAETLPPGRPCFLVKLTGTRPFIGPYLVRAPGQPCIGCLTRAFSQQRPVERLLVRDGALVEWPELPRAFMRPSIEAVANLAALKLRAILSHRDAAAMAGRLWALDLATFELSEHVVRHFPQCAACGSSALQARQGERPIRLAAVPFYFFEDGGFRCRSPRQSYKRLRHLVSPILGPVTHLHPMPGRHGEEHPVYSSGYMVAPRRVTATNTFDRSCAGKGCTREQARMSALAEAVERYSGVYQGDEAVRRASYTDLGGKAIHPSSLQLFSPLQLAHDTANDARSAPPPLDQHTEIDWIPAWSLTNRCRRYLPLAYCYTEAPSEAGAAYCRPSSNGNAAGNCLEEAILQGLLELVERDAVAIWWYGCIRRPAARVPRAAVDYYAKQRDRYEDAGWSMWVLDLTHDVGIAVFAAVAVQPTNGRLALGFGCHFDENLALRRAVSELNQIFDPRGEVRSPWDGLQASQLDYLYPDTDAAEHVPQAPWTGSNLREYICAVVKRLRALDLEMIVVDKTRLDLDLAVAQVVVPGMRHVWPRFAPGRLYSVPVAMGWRERPATEHELNRHPLLI